MVIIMSLWQHWPCDRTGWALLFLMSIPLSSHYKAEVETRPTLSPFSELRLKKSIPESQELPQPYQSFR